MKKKLNKKTKIVKGGKYPEIKNNTTKLTEVQRVSNERVDDIITFFNTSIIENSDNIRNKDKFNEFTNSISDELKKLNLENIKQNTSKNTSTNILQKKTLKSFLNLIKKIYIGIKNIFMYLNSDDDTESSQVYKSFDEINKNIIMYQKKENKRPTYKNPSIEQKYLDNYTILSIIINLLYIKYKELENDQKFNQDRNNQQLSNELNALGGLPIIPEVSNNNNNNNNNNNISTFINISEIQDISKQGEILGNYKILKNLSKSTKSTSDMFILALDTFINGILTISETIPINVNILKKTINAIILKFESKNKIPTQTINNILSKNVNVYSSYLMKLGAINAKQTYLRKSKLALQNTSLKSQASCCSSNLANTSIV